MMDKGSDEGVEGPDAKDGVDGVNGIDGDHVFLGWQRVEGLCIYGDRERHERVSPLNVLTRLLAFEKRNCFMLH